MINARPPSRQMTGSDGHPYLTDEKVVSKKITITESSLLNKTSPQRGRLRPSRRKDEDTDAIHLDDYLQESYDKPNVKLPSPTIHPSMEEDPNL